jgi:hypothetical protein
MLFHLQAIRDYVRADFNQSDVGSFIQEADIDRWANEAYMYYARKLMLTSEGYFEQTFGLDITAGTETIALPTVFDGRGKHLKTILLERCLATCRVPLQYHRRYTEANSTNGGVSGLSYLPRYKFRGNNIVLEPTPTFSETSTATSGLLLTAQVMPPHLHLGTAAAGGATSITFDSLADPRNSYYLGASVYIISGTGIGQVRVISAYVGTTKVATVPTWTVNPDTTSIFSILIHEDFPEDFHEIIPLYATKCALGKERSNTTEGTHIITRLKGYEEQLKDFCEDRTEARKFVQPWNVEIA